MIELGYVEPFEFSELARREHVANHSGRLALQDSIVGGESVEAEDLVTSCGD